MNTTARDDNGGLCALGAIELARLYRSGQASPVEVVQAVLDRIDELNPVLNAYLAVLNESALEHAGAAELQIRAGIDLGPLHGVPVSVKDIIRVKGTRTTAASRVLEDAPEDGVDALVVQRLRAAGAILVGKTNLHEFAHGEPDPDSPFGVVQNPRRMGHQSGSSSSGSAAAVAAGLGVLSIGTDTGGSIRHPASVCGVVGLKPTYGLVPLEGVIPLSTQLDHVGPMARSISDVAACLGAIAGHPSRDPSSALAPADGYLSALGRDVRGLRLGVPTNRCYQFGEPAVHTLLKQAQDALVDLGMSPVALDVPMAEEAKLRVRAPHDPATIIQAVDLWSYHSGYRDKEALYGRDFLSRARVGLETTALEYAHALEVKSEIRRLWLGLFERVDILAIPANVGGAPAHGVSSVEINGEVLPARLVTSPFSRASNLTGFPALSMPVGELPGGLPVGIQLIGPPFGEARLLAVGHALEQALGNLPGRWGIEPRDPGKE